MRLLLRNETGDFGLTKDLTGDDPIPPYAILSHTWSESENEEVTFEDMTNSTGRNKPGFEKVRFCGEQARQDGLQYFWIDTCCINKKNNAELSRSINSMFRWYRNATRCYVYLSDVLTRKRKRDGNSRDTWEWNFRKSRWFTRGWTLQELLGPVSVEFFSRERMRLGDKCSLEQEIYEITGIPQSALQGDSLSQFSVNERLSWINTRQTKLEEDKAYSLLGIFGVYIAPLYGEGMGSAFKRLREEIDKLETCIRHLRLTDPRDDKNRIENSKGGLLDGAYRWILENSDFQQWCSAQQRRLLWIKGDPGKGKTMLLCGIVNELKKSIARSDLLSYFFCQAADARINNATAVLRGLIYTLVAQQPSLISHIRKKYDLAGKTLFEDANAWVALSEIFTNILQDPSLNSTYLIVDALDECVADLPELLDFVVRMSAGSPCVKWIVSSRNWPDIEERLEKAGHKAKLCLELNAESVSMAVKIFIQHKVLQLAQQKNYDNKTQDAVLEHLSLNANGTFLWVALVCQNLESIPQWKILTKLSAFPPGLNSLYRRMMEQICKLEDAKLYKRILALIAIVYRPITLEELTSLVAIPEDMPNDLKSLGEIIGLCGSFLTIREGTIYLVHQSAKDYLFKEAFHEIFPSGKGEAHYQIFSRSLQVMSRTLRRDIYSLGALGYPIERMKQPDPDPLAASRYSCIYWVDHLSSSSSCANYKVDLQDGGAVEYFAKKKYLYWLEALSLCRSMSEGVVSIAKLESLLQARADASRLLKFVHNARRFIMYHKVAIENSPLQVYASALMFSPARDLIRSYFKHEEPNWITIRSAIRDEWSACLQTLEGHLDCVSAVAFSLDGSKLASGSKDKTVRVWDAATGTLQRTLRGHSDGVGAVVFSPDSSKLASGSYDKTVRVWDAATGKLQQMLRGHLEYVSAVVFSPDGSKLASGSWDKTVRVWDAATGKLQQRLEGHSDGVNAAAFSPDGLKLVSGSKDKTVRVWDAATGKLQQTLKGHSEYVSAVAFSPDGSKLASGSYDKTVRVRDAATGKLKQTLDVSAVALPLDGSKLASGSEDKTNRFFDALTGTVEQTPEGHSDRVRAVAFSPDGSKLASGLNDKTVRVWDAATGTLQRTLEGHSFGVRAVAFSPDGSKLASGSWDKTVRVWDAFSLDGSKLASGSNNKTVRVWDAATGKLEGHSEYVRAVAFSPDGSKLVSGSNDKTVRVWDAATGKLQQTLKGHSDGVGAVAFSPDGSKLASGSWDKTVRVWDAATGKLRQTLMGHSDGVSAVAFSPDGSKLASGSWDETQVWDAATGKPQLTLTGHFSDVDAVAFSPDGSKLASALRDKVQVWDAATGTLQQTLEGHSDYVSVVVFSPDGSQLVSGSKDETVRVWEAATGKLQQTLKGHSSGVGAVAFSTELSRAQYVPSALSLESGWLTVKGEPVLRLPHEYISDVVAVYNNILALGCWSGYILIAKCDL